MVHCSIAQFHKNFLFVTFWHDVLSEIKSPERISIVKIFPGWGLGFQSYIIFFSLPEPAAEMVFCHRQSRQLQTFFKL